MTSNLRYALARLEAVHSSELVGIASMHHLCKHLLTHYCKANACDPAALIRKLDDCVDSHLFDRDIMVAAYDAAVDDLLVSAKRAMADTSWPPRAS